MEPAGIRRRWEAAAIISGAFGLFLLAGIGVMIRQPLAGDESHYLMITHSLVRDGDINLTNNYAANDWRHFQSYAMTPHRALIPGDQIYSSHGPGFPALIAIPYRFGGRIGVLILVWILAALLINQIYRLQRDLDIPTAPALITSALVALSPPVLIYANLIYPEIPGALLTVFALRRAIRSDQKSPPQALLLGSGVALLIWLHFRLLPMAAMIILLFLWRRPARRAVVALFIPPLISFSLLMTLYSICYGDGLYFLKLSAGFQPGWQFVRGLLGGLTDRQYGLVVTAPLVWLLVIGMQTRPWPRFMAAITGICAVQYAIVSGWVDWHGGWCPPSRYLISVLPLLAPFAGNGLAAMKRTPRWLMTAIVTILTLLVALVWLTDVQGLYQHPTGINALWIDLPLARSIHYMLPSWWGGAAQTAWGTLWLLAIGLALGQWLRGGKMPGPRWRHALPLLTIPLLIATTVAAHSAAVSERQQRLELINTPLDHQPPALILPENQVTIEKDTLTFEWTGVKGATRYQLHMQLPDGMDYRIDVTGNEPGFVIPAKGVTLLPGGRYRWRVIPFKDQVIGLPSPWREFRIEHARQPARERRRSL